MYRAKCQFYSYELNGCFKNSEYKTYQNALVMVDGLLGRVGGAETLLISNPAT